MEDHPAAVPPNREPPPHPGTALLWGTAAAWLIGTTLLCCLAQATVYEGLFDVPDPATTATRIYDTAMVVWAFLVPAIGLPISVRRRSWALTAVFAAELALATGCGYLFGFGAVIWA